MPRSVLAHLDVIAGHEDVTRRLVLEMTKKVRQEPGNVTFIPYQAVETPNRYYFYEVYRDEDAFQKHLQTDHCLRFNDSMQNLVVGGASTVVILSEVEA